VIQPSRANAYASQVLLQPTLAPNGRVLAASRPTATVAESKLIDLEPHFVTSAEALVTQRLKVVPMSHARRYFPRMQRLCCQCPRPRVAITMLLYWFVRPCAIKPAISHLRGTHPTHSPTHVAAQLQRRAAAHRALSTITYRLSSLPSRPACERACYGNLWHNHECRFC